MPDDLLERLRHPLGTDPVDRAEQLEVGPPGHRREQRGCLDDCTCALRGITQALRNRPVEQADHPGGGSGQSEDTADRCRLA